LCASARQRWPSKEIVDWWVAHSAAPPDDSERESARAVLRYFNGSFAPPTPSVSRAYQKHPPSWKALSGATFMVYMRAIKSPAGAVRAAVLAEGKAGK